MGARYSRISLHRWLKKLQIRNGSTSNSVHFLRQIGVLLKAILDRGPRERQPRHRFMYSAIQYRHRKRVPALDATYETDYVHARRPAQFLPKGMQISRLTPDNRTIPHRETPLLLPYRCEFRHPEAGQGFQSRIVPSSPVLSRTPHFLPLSIPLP